MSLQYRWKQLEKYCVRELDYLLLSVPRYDSATYEDKGLVRDIMRKRCYRLNHKFKWTPENIKRIVKVSDKFLATFEKAVLNARTLIAAMYDKEKK